MDDSSMLHADASSILAHYRLRISAIAVVALLLGVFMISVLAQQPKPKLFCSIVTRNGMAFVHNSDVHAAHTATVSVNCSPHVDGYPQQEPVYAPAGGEGQAGPLENVYEGGIQNFSYSVVGEQ